MKKSRKIIIIALIAVIAVGAMICVGLTLLGNREEEAKYFLTGYDADEITGISVSGSENFFFVKTAENWENANNSEFPVNAEKINALVAEIAGKSIEKISGSSDKSEYGLDSPGIILKIYSGSEYTACYIGDYNELTGVYYVKPEQTDGIYAISASFVEKLLEGENGFVVVPDLALDGEVSSVFVSNENCTISLEKYDEDSPQTWRSGCHWVIENDYGALAVDDEKSDAIIAAASELELLSCYDYSPTAEISSACGFSDAIIVSVEAGNDGLTFELGATADDGARYIRLTGQDPIYLISENTAKVFDFSLSDIAIINPLVGVGEESVESITVKTETGSYVLRRSESNLEKINKVLILSSDAYSADAENYKFSAQVTVTITRNTDKFSTVELELVRFNNLLWVARTWGIGGCFVTDTDVQNMLAAVRS